MRHLDLFSGIGGFALAARWAWGDRHNVVSFCEIDSFCRKVLAKHWPDVPCHENIKTMDGGKYGRIDILTGGFPCQPYSVAGKQRGDKDDRALWPEMLRVIEGTKPRWIIGENVNGFINMGLDNALFDLEAIGYNGRAVVIPACAIGAPHRRDRVWIVANSNSTGRKKLDITTKSERTRLDTRKTYRHDANTTDTGFKGLRKWEIKTGKRQWDAEPGMDRMVDGISRRVDRIRALGNAIVPQVAYEIFRCIQETR